MFVVIVGHVFAKSHDLGVLIITWPVIFFFNDRTPHTKSKFGKILISRLLLKQSSEIFPWTDPTTLSESTNTLVAAPLTNFSLIYKANLKIQNTSH